MTAPAELCAGLAMHLCESCHRNAERHPEAERAPGQRWLRRPAADPPRCLDWKAIPHRAIDRTHGRL